ncbi:MAG: Txe/YoeB family addiction module toxin [Bacteroidota bacterium]|nr:Txe/YoeB family addiction module toxin [Bacteroidota bacterium]
MEIVWQKNAWEDYLYWQKNDKQKLKRINELIKDCQRNKFEGIGKQEPLKENLAGLWSRRIDNEHRFVYKIEENRLHIIQCRYHY